MLSCDIGIVCMQMFESENWKLNLLQNQEKKKRSLKMGKRFKCKKKSINLLFYDVHYVLRNFNAKYKGIWFWAA